MIYYMPRRSLTTEQFVQRAREVHADSFVYLFSETPYVKMATPFKVICKKCSHESMHYPQNHLRGHGCRFCKKKKPKKDVADFEEQCREMYQDQYEYSQDYYGVANNISIKCRKCTETFSQRAGRHLRGHGCPRCNVGQRGIAQRKPIHEFEEQARRIHEGRYEYCGDYINSTTKIRIVCKQHGNFRQSPASHLQGIGCPTCSSSKGEEAIAKFLTDHGVAFDRQAKMPGCVRKRHLNFDFYLPDRKLYIEFDGVQHFRPIQHFGGEKDLVRHKEVDEIKNKCCEKAAVSLLRIPYHQFRNINSILNKTLKQ